MKKITYTFTALLLFSIISCAGYTDDQSNAADAFCECMEKEGDFDINFFECDLEILKKYKPETFADEGWALALEEKCPSVAGEIANGE